MDVERMESHVAKWLSDNCVDTNATVLQNVRLFMDHVSNVYKDKVALYETRDDMERLPSDAGIAVGRREKKKKEERRSRKRNDAAKKKTSDQAKLTAARAGMQRK